MRKRTRAAAAVIGAIAFFGTITPVGAHPEPTSDGGLHDDGDRDAHLHGDGDGHLPASNSGNIALVSKLAMKNAEPEKIADVGVHKGYAYLAAWGVVTCKYNGVHVVDIRNPAKPKEVAFIQAKEGSYPGEGVQAVSISTPKFTGDILVTNNEKCKDKVGFGGLNIYDVTNPSRPTPLVEGLGDSTVNGQGKKDANEIHSVFAWDAGDKAYAVIVDNEEGPDVDIIDITDPKKAKLVAEYDLDELFPHIVQPGLREVFHHDVIVKEIAGRQIMSVSYWDAGYVLLDVTNPLAPTYVADSDFATPDPENLSYGRTVKPEGNGHQSEFTRDNKYLVGADEDFAPYVVSARNETENNELFASPGSGTTPLTPGTVLSGGTVFVGLACPGGTAVPAGNPAVIDIAVVERGVCTFTEKVASVVAAGGYDGVLVFNRTGTDACDGQLTMSVEGSLPAFGVLPRSQGFALFGQSYDDSACLAGTGPQTLPVALGTVGDNVSFVSTFDGWGYVRLFRNGNGKLTELDTYAVPESQNPAFAQGYGDLSVHEVATSAASDNLLYFSYYTAGFRVAKIENDRIVEKGHFIDEGGNNFWGVETFMHNGQEYVAASDRDFGLYIFRYTGN